MCIINSPQVTAELAKLGAEERQLRSHVERIELRISRSQIWGGGRGGVGAGLVAQSRRSIVRTVQLFKPTALMRVGIGLAPGRDEPGRDEPTSETTRGGRESRGRVAHAPCPPPIIKAIEPMSIADCAALSVGDQLIGITPPPPHPIEPPLNPRPIDWYHPPPPPIKPPLNPRPIDRYRQRGGDLCTAGGTSASQSGGQRGAHGEIERE